MYKLYDLDMNEIPFPEGVMPLDFLVGAISKTRETEDIPGRHGVMNYGFNYNSRPVTINMLLTANDRIDFQLLRNEIYALFNIHDEFYIADNLLPSRVLKVAVDESYSPEKFNHTDAEVTINCRTLDSVFWESKYTTLELHDSGYSATVEKYGLVDNIDDEKVQYRFEPKNTFNPNLIPMNPGDWENGSRWESGSYDNTTSAHVRMKIGSAITVVPGRRYVIQDNSTFNSRMDYMQIHVLDDNGEVQQYIFRRRGGTANFTAQGTRLVISINVLDTFDIPLDYIGGDRIRLKLEEGDNHTGFEPEVELFSVYNAGNVTVEPESMYLHIIANTVTTPGGFTITNKTTGDEFVFNEEINGQSILLRGMDIRVSSIYNRFRDTNRRFISLAPGDNEFEVTGGSFNHIRFDFKYLYK